MFVSPEFIEIQRTDLKAEELTGDARAEQTKVNLVKELMKNTKFSLEQALTALGIKGKERAIIAK